MNYEMQVQECLQRIETALEAAIPEATAEPLRSAMRYALLAPGKRLRPMLLIKSYEMLSPAAEDILPFAAAMEMIHAYSLVHDDLPAMDNDVLRRGRPTCHVAYGEAMAILAGDGLLNLAYETMLASCHPRALQAAHAIAAQAGVHGMVGGQGLDIAFTGQQPDKTLIERMQTGKTAALFIAAVSGGLILAGADERQLEAGAAYGLGLGRAFQIIDDLLDLNGDIAQLGKTPGKDAEYWTGYAVDALAAFGGRAGFLRETALRALNRIR